VLPLKPGQHMADTSGGDAHDLPAMHILIADDIQQNLDLLNILLTHSGHRVTMASDGAEAVHHFMQDKFDMILMDVQMPQVDGLTAAGQIRVVEAERQLPRTPIIALTASVLQEDRKAAFSAGMDGFASKPVDIHALNREIKRVLNIQDTNSLRNVSARATSKAKTKTKAKVKSTANIAYDKGLAMWGDAALYRQQLQQFASDRDAHFVKLALWVQQPDNPALHALAHATKGVAGNLALMVLHQHYAKLESQAAGTQAAVIDMDTLHAAWDDFIQDLQALEVPAASAQPKAAAHTPFNSTQFLTLLDQLAQSATQAEIDDQLLASLSHTGTAQYQTMIQQITLAFNDFEFEQAADTIATLKTHIAGASV